MLKISDNTLIATNKYQINNSKNGFSVLSLARRLTAQGGGRELYKQSSYYAALLKGAVRSCMVAVLTLFQRVMGTYILKFLSFPILFAVLVTKVMDDPYQIFMRLDIIHKWRRI